MITVLPAEGSQLLPLFTAQGLPFTPDSGGVIAKNGQEQLGFCLYRMDDKAMTVLALSPLDDLLLADGVLRSALHVAVNHGIADVHYAETAPEKLFEKLGFVENSTEKALDVTLLFRDCKGCK